MNIIERPSPNFDSRGGQKIDMLVLHYTGMPTADAALARLTDAASRVSSHYLVTEDGGIYRLVPESERAWHAGVSYWRGRTNINHRSIGIEIANPGHEFGYAPFPPLQMQAVAALCRDILARHAMPQRNIVAHSDIAPVRKEDPGELFEWEWLARQQIGLWPLAKADMADASQLSDYGYDISDLPKAIAAFQRHFRQYCVNGQWDNECGQRLAALLAMV